MDRRQFIKQELFHDVFINGQLGTVELADVLYPNRDIEIVSQDLDIVSQDLDIVSQDIDSLSREIYSKTRADSSDLYKNFTRVGIFENSHRNRLMIEKTKLTIDEVEVFDMNTTPKGKKREMIVTPALALVNQPFPTIKSKLGGLTTIITDAPKPRIPGGNKKIVRDPIYIPTHNATKVTEGRVVRPSISNEADIVPFTPDQNIQKVLDGITSKDFLLQKDGGLSTNELKETAKSLGIKVNTANRSALILGIKELMKKYGRDT